MKINSITYNNGKYLKITYHLVPESGDPVEISTIIDTDTGGVVDINENTLTPDLDSVNKFQLGCCPVEEIEEECEGWITESGLCWTTSDGFSWGL